jgi:DNA-binding response OmpR family regulator
LSDRLPAVLLIEDDETHALLVKRCFEDVGLAEVNWIEDGEEALNYLFKRGEHYDAQSPDLILLDLRLPKKDGKEVLKEIKSRDELRSIPVIILTTSNSSRDRRDVYSNHADGYLVKPLGFDEFQAMIESIGYQWLK